MEETIKLVRSLATTITIGGALLLVHLAMIIYTFIDLEGNRVWAVPYSASLYLTVSTTFVLILPSLLTLSLRMTTTTAKTQNPRVNDTSLRLEWLASYTLSLPCPDSPASKKSGFIVKRLKRLRPMMEWTHSNPSFSISLYCWTCTSERTLARPQKKRIWRCSLSLDFFFKDIENDNKKK